MKKIIFVMVLVILLISVGCVPRRMVPVGEEEYHKGTRGLVVEFIKNMPPKEVWEGNEFIIGLELRNEGAYNIEDGIVKVSGFDPRYIEPDINEKVIEFLAGKSPGYPEGDFMVMNFHERNIDIPKGAAEYPAAFTVSIEYDYKTEASAVVCVDPKIFSIVKTREVCEVKAVSLSGGQGAPVTITQIEESITPFDNELRVEFVIYVANKGKGKIKEKVSIDYVKLSETNMECREKEFDLKGKDEKKIHCWAIVERGLGARKVPLRAQFSYSYGIKLDKKIKIVGFVG